jgi:hypothetical protein
VSGAGEVQGQPVAVYNPKDNYVMALPVIYGFNNGGGGDMWFAQLIAQDGTALGSHCCSHEGFMPGDLGIIEGTRPDRHEGFRRHYPDGYRMEFVPGSEVKRHAGLKEAFRLNRANRKPAKAPPK